MTQFWHLIDSDIDAPQLSMPRSQSIFEFARLVPFVAPNVVGFFLANPQSTFESAKSNSFKNVQKKIACGAKIFYISK